MRPVCGADKLTVLMCQLSRNPEDPIFLEIYEPGRRRYRNCLTFYYCKLARRIGLRVCIKASRSAETYNGFSFNVNTTHMYGFCFNVSTIDFNPLR